MSYTKYKCQITGKTFDQKSHIDKHLKSNTFKQQSRIKVLELEKLSESKLMELYGTSKIESIINNLKCVKIKVNNYKLIKQKKDGSIYHKLNKKEIKSKELEKSFKNEFKNKLKKWHNILSGCGITGDPAFDDIINILIMCYLESKISEKGKYDFLNFNKYSNDLYDKEDFNDFVKMLNIENLLKDTKNLTNSQDDNVMSSFKKIGIVLSSHKLTKPMFPNEDFINCNKDNILSQLILEIYEYSKETNIFNYQDLVGIAYEFWLNEYQGNSGKELGNYFTERDLMLMTFQLINKEDIDKYINNNSIIGDEFCGTFGYPLYMKQFLKSKFNIKIKDKNIYGVEIGERHSRLAMINAMFSLNEFNNVKQGDGFITNISEHLDLSIHNVPFGKRISYSNTKEHYDNYKANHPEIPEFKDIIPIDIGKCDASIASQMVLYKTKHIGICIIKDGQETTGTGKFIKYRKYFCDNCNLKKILKIPGGIFSSTATKTVCLYFLKDGKTNNIEFMELNNNCDTITNLVKVSYNDLKNNNYSWNPNTYMIDEHFASIIEKSNCEFKKLGDIVTDKIVKKTLTGNKLKKGPYKYFTCSKDEKNCSEYHYTGKYLIQGSRGTIKDSIFITNEFDKFSLGTSMFMSSCNNNNLSYIYYYMLHNKSIISNLITGGGIPMISKEQYYKILIPIPSLNIQNETVEKLNLLSNRKKGLEENNNLIDKQMKFYIINQIKKNLNNIEIKELGDIVISLKNGKDIKSVNRVKGKYPFYGANGIIDHIDKYLFDGTYLLTARTGSLGSLHISKGKFWCTGDVHRMEFASLKLLKYVYYYLKTVNFQIYRTGSAHPKLSSTNLKSINIPLTSEKQKNIIVDYLDNLEKIKKINNKQIQELEILMYSILEQSYCSNNDDFTLEI